MSSTDRIADRLRELEGERDPRRRHQIATAIGTALIKSAARKQQNPPPPKPAREPEPAPKTKWRPLSDLRATLKTRAAVTYHIVRVVVQHSKIDRPRSE
jgi:hypothetical protein